MSGHAAPGNSGNQLADSAKAKWRVLLVEDNEDQVELVRRAFEVHGSHMELLVAQNLPLARRLIDSEPPDLILADVRLPGGNGLDLLRKEPKPDIPIIVMTSFGDEKMAVEAIKAGALDYLAKSPSAFADIPHVATRAIHAWKSDREREQAQQALREAEEREKIILDSIPTGLITTDLTSGRIVETNQAALRMIGHPEQQVLGTRTQRLLYPEPEVPDNCPSASPGGEDATLVTAVGEEVPVMRSSAYILLNDRPHRVDCITDITERKRNEEQTARLSAAVAETADAVVITDANRLVQYINPAFERITGYEPDDVLGKSIDLIQIDHAQEDTEELDLLTQELHGPVRKRLNSLRKNGSAYQAEAIVSPVHNDSGVIVNYVSVMRDVTRETALEAQLRQSQKMEAIGQLAGGVAHDFNNLLYVIINSAYFLQDSIGDDVEQRSDLEAIISAANRAAGLARQLLAFSKLQPLTPITADLNGLVTGLEKMLKRLLGEDMQILLNLSPEPCYAKVDRGQIEQVIVNLAVNARDAMAEGGRLTIRTSRTKLDLSMAARFLEPADMSAGRYVMITVSDNGTGIDPDFLPHIFEPFFTTKEKDRGTGLGLATVYGICKRHDGQIAVDSEVGIGTTFSIYLPEQDALALDVPGEESLKRNLPGGTETILLAEDDPHVRKLGERILSSLGYHVLSAENGERALSVASTYAGEIDLMLTDVVMPVMNGFVLSERIREIYPDIKVLFVSGYPADRFERNIDLERLTPMLAKPFRARELANTIRQLLDDPLSATTGDPS
jgi:two-component system NtrC family sensor kinase